MHLLNVENSHCLYPVEMAHAKLIAETAGKKLRI